MIYTGKFKDLSRMWVHAPETNAVGTERTRSGLAALWQGPQWIQRGPHYTLIPPEIVHPGDSIELVGGRIAHTRNQWLALAFAP